MRKDKIINNSYNAGEIEYVFFNSPMKIDDKVSDQYKETFSENIIELKTFKMLEEKIYIYFKDSEFFEKYKIPKRVDKSDMIKMYYFFKNKLVKHKAYSNMEIFIGFAEFFQINYDQLYTEIGVRDKEELLKELQERYGVEKKIKVKKLF